jgi:homoserine O-succinyltransferase
MAAAATLATDAEASRANQGRSRVVIAFVNNMPDAALRSCDRQFRSLLQTAQAEFDVDFRGFYCSQIPRSELAVRTFLHAYRDVSDLWESGVDGLIVTGAEPKADQLRDEPCWDLISRLVGWAEERSIPAIWSCLAAHAAVLRLSGISRKPLGKKMSGLYECRKAADHPLSSGGPEAWLVPHSRFNDLPRTELVEKGFLPLTILDEGVDSFIREGKSLFVFLQGHPEYDADSLLLEYVRDVKRFLDGVREDYPDAPAGYFDPATEDELENVRADALSSRDRGALNRITEILNREQLHNKWRPASSVLFRNWLRHVARQRSASKGQGAAEFAAFRAN